MGAAFGVTALLIALLGAKTGGLAADRLRRPRVPGELAARLILGNLALAGIAGLAFLKTDPVPDVAAIVGKQLCAAGDDVFVALVLTVIATTIVTPLVLKRRFSTAPRRSSAS